LNADIKLTLNEAAEYLTGPKYVDLYAKTQALDIHQFRGTPQHLRPRISEQVPKRAFEIAYNYVLDALKYFEEEAANDETDIALQHAAQLLEKLFLNRPADTPHRTMALQTAALAYYLAGHYARAFVLMRGVIDVEDRPTYIMRLLFLREVHKIRYETLKVLGQRVFIDAHLTDLVRRGDIDDIEAVKYALEGTINRAFLFFYEYANIRYRKFDRASYCIHTLRSPIEH